MIKITLDEATQQNHQAVQDHKDFVVDYYSGDEADDPITEEEAKERYATESEWYRMGDGSLIAYWEDGECPVNAGIDAYTVYPTDGESMSLADRDDGDALLDQITALE